MSQWELDMIVWGRNKNLKLSKKKNKVRTLEEKNVLSKLTFAIKKLLYSYIVNKLSTYKIPFLTLEILSINLCDSKTHL